MAYRFKLDEPFQKGLRRILLEQVGAIEQLLSTMTGDEAKAIHESRKSIKRVRALLRLVRPGLGEHDFNSENTAFRDISALLAVARDRHVLLQTIAKLEGSSEGELASAATALRRAIDGETATSEEAGQPAQRIGEALAGLKSARKRIARLRLDPNSFDPLAQGLQRSHARSIEAMALAFADETDEAFHEWRKEVQRHWRHMQLLSHAWPEYMAARVALAKSLSQTIGDDHDYAMLAAFAADTQRSGLTPGQTCAVVEACRSAQAELRRAAAAQGARLLAERPKSLARHVRALWSAAAQAKRSERAPGKTRQPAVAAGSGRSC